MKKKKHTKSKQTKSDNKSGNNYFPIIPNAEERTKPDHENPHSTDKKQNNADNKPKTPCFRIWGCIRKQKFTDWLIALATIAIFFTGLLQWDAIREQRKEMQSASRLDQRAWIGVNSISGIPELGKPLTISVFFKNTGKTPAKRIQIASIIEGIPNDKTPNFPIENSATRTGQGIAAPQAEVFSVNKFAHGQNLDKTIIQGITAGTYHIYVHGICEYDDIFDRHHWVTFCFRLRNDGNGYTAYKEHNDTDSN
jgi:hypothetical protein